MLLNELLSQGIKFSRPPSTLPSLDEEVGPNFNRGQVILLKYFQATNSLSILAASQDISASGIAHAEPYISVLETFVVAANDVKITEFRK